MRAFSFKYVALFFLMHGAMAGAATPPCPPSMLETPTLSRESPLWKFSAKTDERALESVAVFLGPQSELGALVPDSTKKVKNQELVSWNIQPAANETLWLGCAYVGTTAMFIQPIANTATRCVVTYALIQKTGRRLRVESVACN